MFDKRLDTGVIGTQDNHLTKIFQLLVEMNITTFTEMSEEKDKKIKRGGLYQFYLV